MYLWPKTLDVEVMDPTKYVYALSTVFLSYVFMMLSFLLFYINELCWDFRALKKPVGILNTKVLRAMKLKKKDLLGASDPYVKLTLTDDKLTSKKTTVKHKNLNPEWNEEFSLVVKDPETQSLEFHVYDWEQVCFLRLIL